MNIERTIKVEQLQAKKNVCKPRVGQRPIPNCDLRMEEMSVIKGGGATNPNAKGSICICLCTNSKGRSAR
jgi:hypothetical protein